MRARYIYGLTHAGGAVVALGAILAVQPLLRHEGAYHRPYHQASVTTMRTLPLGQVPTHVAVTGTVGYVDSEPDGDTHFRLYNGADWIVCEIMPTLEVRLPRRGQRVTVYGISRWDSEHLWPELHPVERWEVTP